MINQPLLEEEAKKKKNGGAAGAGSDRGQLRTAGDGRGWKGQGHGIS
jgi:hypothetical protein